MAEASFGSLSCRTCGAPIVWLNTKAGKAMPVDAATVTAGDVTYQPGKHISHFATCPNANLHRKTKPRSKGESHD